MRPHPPRHRLSARSVPSSLGPRLRVTDAVSACRRRRAGRREARRVAGLGRFPRVRRLVAARLRPRFG